MPTVMFLVTLTKVGLMNEQEGNQREAWEGRSKERARVELGMGKTKRLTETEKRS